MPLFRKIWAHPAPADEEGRKMYKSDTGSLSLEKTVIERYFSEGYTGLLTPDTYWWMLMTLLFWDVIYAKLQGVYSHEKGEFPGERQDAPKDFMTPDFYTSRRHLIEHRVDALMNEPKLEAYMKEVFEEHHGKRCRTIPDWHLHHLEHLAVAIKLIRKEDLIVLLNYMLEDFNQRKDGLPGIILARQGKTIFIYPKEAGTGLTEHEEHWATLLAEGLEKEVHIAHVEEKEEDFEAGQRLGIRFTHNSNRTSHDAIDLIQNQPDYHREATGPKIIHHASFDPETELDKIESIVNMTSQWENFELTYCGKPTDINSVTVALFNCYRRRNGDNYCFENLEGKANPYGCRLIYLEPVDIGWFEPPYGRMENGKWITNKEMLKSKLESQVALFAVCPMLESSTVVKCLDEVPEAIQPGTDSDWEYIRDKQGHNVGVRKRYGPLPEDKEEELKAVSDNNQRAGCLPVLSIMIMCLTMLGALNWLF